MSEGLEERKVLKVPGGNEAPSNGPQQNGPMGDASAAPDPQMSQPMGDPNIGMGQPEEQNTPQMDDQGMPPMDTPMDDQGGGMVNAEDDEMMNLLSQLSIEDKAAAKKYIESMIDDANDYEQEGEEEAANGEQSMFESVVFTKGQLSRIHESIRPSMEDNRNSKSGLAPQKKRNNPGKSPFNAPEFK